MPVRPKDPAELHYEIAGLQPGTVNLADGSDISGANVYKRAHDDYVATFLLERENPENLQGALDRFHIALSGVENGGANLLLSRGPHRGIPAALRKARFTQEKAFTDQLSSFVEQSPLSEEEISKNREILEKKTLSIDRDEGDESLREELFPSGNWLLYSAGTDSIVKILNSGQIMTTAGLSANNNGNVESIGGFSGVSFNFNYPQIVMGETRHLAGFMADPAQILESQGGILAVPQKSCWNELQYYNAEPEDIWDIRHHELNFMVTSALISLVPAMTAFAHGSSAVKQMTAGNEALAQMLIEKGNKIVAGIANPNVDLYRKGYIKRANGAVEFSAIVGNFDEAEVFLTFMQAIKDGVFGEDLAGVLQRQNGSSGRLDFASMQAVGQALKKHLSVFDKKMQEISAKIGEKSAVDVTNTVFYCPRKDYDLWLDTLSRSPVQPRGIIVYDGREVRAPAAFSDGGLKNNGRTVFAQQLEKLKNADKKLDWAMFFEGNTLDSSKVSHYLADPIGTANAGVMVYEEGKLAIKSLDEIDDDD